MFEKGRGSAWKNDDSWAQVAQKWRQVPPLGQHRLKKYQFFLEEAFSQRLKEAAGLQYSYSLALRSIPKMIFKICLFQ